MAAGPPALHTRQTSVEPVPPFDFAQSLRFLGEFPPAAGEQVIVDGVLTKAIRVAAQTVLFRVQSLGTVEEPLLRCSLFSDTAIDDGLQATVLDRVAMYLSVNDDLRAFYALARQDTAFLPVLEQLYGYHQVKFLTPFENACWALLSQRTSATVARLWKRRLIERFGSCLVLEGDTYWAFPEPADLARAGAAEISSLIPNAQKVERLQAAAVAFAGVEEHFLRTAPYEVVDQWLRTIPGIGAWSSSFILLRGLGRMDQALAVDDRSVFTQEILQAARRVYGHDLDVAGLGQLAAGYGVWQGYWAHYLRVAP